MDLTLEKIQWFDICIKQRAQMALTLQKIQGFDISSIVKLMTFAQVSNLCLM